MQYTRDRDLKRALLSIDIGGTKLAAGVANASGDVTVRRRADTPPNATVEAVLDQLHVLVDSALTEAEAAGVAAIGLSLGGPVDRVRGLAIQWPGIPAMAGFPIRDHFARRYGAPVSFDNDANAAALAECRFGAGKGLSPVVYFTISTGVGGGVVIDGRLFRGATDGAGELGHLIVEPDGPSCPCGRWGCLEALASGTAIARMARERVQPGSVLLEVAGGDAAGITAEVVALAARRGDPVARRVWEEACHYLGLGICDVVHVLNPQRVILGGGVTKAGDYLLRPVQEVVRTRVMPALAGTCDVVLADLGPDVALMGAVCLAMDAAADTPDAKP